MGKILVVGSINMERDHLHQPDAERGRDHHRHGVFAVAGGQRREPGRGRPPGWKPRPPCTSCVGDDVFGHELTRSLGADGVDTRAVKVLGDASTGVASITVCDGDNRIILHAGANARVDPDASLEPLIEESDALLIQLEIPMETVLAVIDMARGLGKRVFLTPAPARALLRRTVREDRLPAAQRGGIQRAAGEGHRRRSGRLLGAEPVPRPRRGAAGDHAGRAAASGCSLKASRASCPRTAWRASIPPRRGTHSPARWPSAIVDGMALDEAVDFAQRAAAICVTRPGAQNAIPTREEVARAGL